MFGGIGDVRGISCVITIITIITLCRHEAHTGIACLPFSEHRQTFLCSHLVLPHGQRAECTSPAERAAGLAAGLALLGNAAPPPYAVLAIENYAALVAALAVLSAG